MYPAYSALTQAIRQHYGPGDPPVRWLVTANWPSIRVGPLRFPSPAICSSESGRCARVLSGLLRSHESHLYSAQLAQNFPRHAASESPFGHFSGRRGRFGRPIDGADSWRGTFADSLGEFGLPVQPVGTSEGKGRLMMRLGPTISCETLLSAREDAAKLTMQRIAALL